MEFSWGRWKSGAVIMALLRCCVPWVGQTGQSGRIIINSIRRRRKALGGNGSLPPPHSIISSSVCFCATRVGGGGGGCQFFSFSFRASSIMDDWMIGKSRGETRYYNSGGVSKVFRNAHHVMLLPTDRTEIRQQNKIYVAE